MSVRLRKRWRDDLEEFIKNWMESASDKQVWKIMDEVFQWEEKEVVIVEGLGFDTTEEKLEAVTALINNNKIHKNVMTKII